MAASRSKKVKFPYHDGFISESEGRASDDERLTAKGLRRLKKKAFIAYRKQKSSSQKFPHLEERDNNKSLGKLSLRTDFVCLL